jgi:peptide-methionine (S)-S-oxide reductase
MRLLAIFVMVSLAFFPLSAMAENKASVSTNDLKSAIFAGGSFWSLEKAFEGVAGIHGVTAGYSGGKTVHPTYIQVSEGHTGHRQAIQIVYDPAKVSYERLLNIYWRNTDPFNGGGQFCDRGDEYKPAIFVRGDDQKAAAQKSKAEMEKRFGKTVATEILPASAFFLAEDYHQNYADEHSLTYELYRQGCGQDNQLMEIWGAEAGGGVFLKRQ